MQRALFIGRWQPLHPGHKWLFNQKLEKNIPILIAVRDTPVNDSNPFTTDDVISSLEKEYSEGVESGDGKNNFNSDRHRKCDIGKISGRGVGYEFKNKKLLEVPVLLVLIFPPELIGRRKIHQILKN